MSRAVDEPSLRREICTIGRRLYDRGYVSGNDGNISARLADEEVLCTPTMISKGFMSPDDLCVVDLDGVQVRGARRRTSELLLHLELYKQNPEALAVVHCHAPHALAFALSGEVLPTGILPEVEVFLGVVPRVSYETPGTAAFARTIRPHAASACAALLANHGTVTWARSLEQALWNTEILDSYCRVLLLARAAGPIERLPADKVRELLRLRADFGLPPDPRADDPNAALHVNREYGA